MKVKQENVKLQGKKKKFSDGHWALTGMLLPGIIYVFIFSYIPMFGLVIAFKDYKYNLGIFGSKFVGLKNFEFLFSSQTLGLLVRNTLGYGIAFMILGVISGVFIALMLNLVTSKISIKIFQSAMFLPYLLSWIVVSYVTHALFSAETGMLNVIQRYFGFKETSFYTAANLWPFILCFFSVWKGFGFNGLIYYGSILSIDSELFEAAIIDGCGYVKQIKYIILPHLKKTIIILCILGLGSILRSDYGLFMFLTKESGALLKVTDVLDTYILRSLRTSGNLGISSAVGFLQSIVGFVLVVTANWIVNKIDPESAMF